MHNETDNEIWRLPRVMAAVGVGRSTVYDMQRRGDFPRAIRLGARAVGWRRADIEQWIASRERA